MKDSGTSEVVLDTDSRRPPPPALTRVLWVMGVEVITVGALVDTGESDLNFFADVSSRLFPLDPPRGRGGVLGLWGGGVEVCGGED